MAGSPQRSPSAAPFGEQEQEESRQSLCPCACRVRRARGVCLAELLPEVQALRGQAALGRDPRSVGCEPVEEGDDLDLPVAAPLHADVQV